MLVALEKLRMLWNLIQVFHAFHAMSASTRYPGLALAVYVQRATIRAKCRQYALNALLVDTQPSIKVHVQCVVQVHSVVLGRFSALNVKQENIRSISQRSVLRVDAIRTLIRGSPRVTRVLKAHLVKLVQVNAPLVLMASSLATEALNANHVPLHSTHIMEVNNY